MSARRAWGSIALILAAVGCGGGSNPAAVSTPTPVPVAVPSPTPPPRITFSLDASADHYRFSSPLARLSAGQAFELTVKPLRINESPGEKFVHSVEVWLWSTGTTQETFTESGVALSLWWLGESDWIVSYYAPESLWRQTRHRSQLQLGGQGSIRVARGADGAVEFFLDERSVLTLSDSEAVKVVLARVVGAGAEFSYLPLGSANHRSSTTGGTGRYDYACSVSSIPCGRRMSILPAHPPRGANSLTDLRIPSQFLSRYAPELTDLFGRPPIDR